MNNPKKIQLWINRDLYNRITRVAQRGEITEWATNGIEQGVIAKEEELIRNSQRQDLLAQLQEKAS